MKSPVDVDLNQSSLSARVSAAPALGGTKMYQVKISCKGKKSMSMYKTKDDFKNVINMFKLIGAMARGKDNPCVICTECSALTMVRCCDEESLNSFLANILEKLRKSSPDAIADCSSHKGAIQILMDFLSVRNGKYFCDAKSDSGSESELTDPLAEGQENDHDHPVEHCSLNRSLSQQFAALDSVC
ncbi:TPA: hypothetical protein N0F65_008723 [Lagenidium giganteum]|uniref:Uncharacterized protein n=1 Tax=Lagenidium giganteum TaxID=4803 RepID=A0AAV2YRZ6_9STRA|nr:TPA: hypothetical protein N0F65_008723 [Lagenidium giganteum]